MSDTELYETTGPQPTRRGLLKAGAAGGAAAVVGAGALPETVDPVQEGEAIPPAIVAGVVIAAKGTALGWTLRDAEVLGSDDVAEGLTPEATREQVYQTAQARESNNKSTIVDNRNLVETGLEHAAYADAKIAAIEKMNNGEQEQDVINAAHAELDGYEADVKRNFIKSWNESAREFGNLAASVESHADLSPSSVFEGKAVDDLNVLHHGETTIEQLPDGTEIEAEIIGYGFRPTTSTYDRKWHFNYANPEATNGIDENEDDAIVVKHPDESDRTNGVFYQDHLAWRGIWDLIEEVFTDVRDGIALWVSNTYDDVQSGDLDTADLLTPRELAEMTADDEEFNQAVADLMALNIPVDLEREATISLSEVDGTLYGQLATTDSTTISSGETINPDSDQTDYYFTYDLAQGHGQWTDFEAGLDGGVATFTSEPYPDVVFLIETNAGETAEVTADDFTHDETDDVWTVDLSGLLEDQIAQIEEVGMYANVDGATFETVQLQQSFTVEEITDADGNEVDNIETDPGVDYHDDENYITEKEWQAQQDRMDELIEQYEDAQGGGLPSFGDVEGGMIAGIAVLVGGLVALSNLLS